MWEGVENAETDFGIELNESAKPYNIRHRSFYLARDVIRFVSECKFETIFSSLFDQLVRSSSSIGANLVEGSAGSSRKDFLKFLIISLKSANETKYWLTLIKESQNVDKQKIDTLLNETIEISKVIAQIIVNTQKSAS